MSAFTIRLMFHGDLSFFLKPKASWIERPLSERTSIKDAIESCGVPHSEVDLILVNGAPVDFAAILTQDAAVDVYPPNETYSPLFPEDRLQVRNIERFVADGHLGKLVRDLRLLGINVTYDPAAEDRQLLRTMERESRALLTRDRRLLMHAVVRHGYYLRSQNPLEQTIEVVRRFDLFSSLAPFSRCLRCNASLESVEKANVIEQLEPLTKIHYEQFRRCTGCGQVYWSGSHFDKLRARVEKVRAALAAGAQAQRT
jgi:uncharacterized protein with PIN domain